MTSLFYTHRKVFLYELSHFILTLSQFIFFKTLNAEEKEGGSNFPQQQPHDGWV